MALQKLIDVAKASVTVSDTVPSTTDLGSLWFESDTAQFFIYYDNTWIEVGGAAVESIINTITGKGQLLVGTESAAVTNLTVGSDNFRLIANSATTSGLEWVADTYNTVIDAKGDLLVGTADNTVTKLSIGTEGHSLVSNSTSSSGLAYGALRGFKNLVINGSMNVWQRGNSFPVTGTSPYYTVDRWQTTRASGATGATFSRQSSNLDGFEYCGRFQRDSGNANTNAILMAQSFESINVKALHGKVITLSFWARAGSNFSSTNSVLTSSMISGTGTDSNILNTGFTSQGTHTTQPNTLTTSWQRFSMSTSSTLANTVTQFGVQFSYTPVGTASTNDYFEITGVQLEASPIATLFEHKTYAQDLQECQRYYYRLVGGDTYSLYAIGFARDGASADLVFNTPVTLRRTPTAIEYSNLYMTRPGVGTVTITGMSPGDGKTIQGGGIYVTGAFSANQTYFLGNNNNVSGYFAFFAEL